MGLNCFLVKAPGNQLQQEDSVVEGVRGGRDSSSLFALSCSGSIRKQQLSFGHPCSPFSLCPLACTGTSCADPWGRPLMQGVEMGQSFFWHRI